MAHHGATRASALCALMLGAALACGKSEPQSSADAGHTPPGVTVKRDAASNWPRPIPVYPNAQPSGSVSDKNGASITFHTSDDGEAVLAFYKSALTSKGWSVVTDGYAGTTHALVFQTAGKKPDLINVSATPKANGFEVDATWVPGD